MAEAAFSEDLIFGGRVVVRQPARGYRVNADTLLLAAAVAPGARLVELGCGVGAASLAAARRLPDSHILGIEREPAFAALARENVGLNGLGDRVRILEADALAPLEGVFDGVFFNPPYDLAGEARAPAPARRAALVAEAPLGDWIRTWSNRMASGAVMTLIQRPQRLSEMLAAFEGRLGGVELLPLRPAPGAAAHRLIARARKGSRAPLKLWDGHALHPEAGAAAKHTPLIEAALRGEAGLWPA